MKIIGMLLNWIGKIIKAGIVCSLCLSITYIAFKGNQPMQVEEAPAGMTYFGFMADRLDAARTVKPARCGWGMMTFLAVLGPIYSVVYTETAIHPDGFIGRITAPDSNIAEGVENAPLHEIPGIWWGTVERLSWTMLGKQQKFGCKFRMVE
jgi:hypothetical protein